MSSSQLATGSRLEPKLRRRFWLLSIPKRKRRPRPLKGGETELLELLGELPRRPRDIDRSAYEFTLGRRGL
jgi:hypothetical protein